MVISLTLRSYTSWFFRSFIFWKLKPQSIFFWNCVLQYIFIALFLTQIPMDIVQKSRKEDKFYVSKC